MAPYITFFQLIAVAVATVVLPYLLAKLYKRKLQVEIFRYRCELEANYAIDNYTGPLSSHLVKAMYGRICPPFLSMLFSRKPLEIEYWFSTTARMTYFPNYTPKKQGSSPYGRAF